MQHTATVSYTSNLPASAPVVWELLQESATLLTITEGWVKFDPKSFPERWQVGQEIKTRVTGFGLIPLGSYTFTFTDIDHQTMTMKTTEHGGVIKDWRHTMLLDEFTDDSCLYTDHVELSAGRLTPLLAKWALRYYQRRHRKLTGLIRELTAKGEVVPEVA